jgi:hypothetical protein
VTVEARDRAHAAELLAALASEGYRPVVVRPGEQKFPAR